MPDSGRSGAALAPREAAQLGALPHRRRTPNFTTIRMTAPGCGRNAKSAAWTAALPSMAPAGRWPGPATDSSSNLLRELADVIVVGVGAVRIEGYSGVRMGVVQRQHRQAQAKAKFRNWQSSPRSSRLDRDMAVFTRTEMAPLVLTTTAVADDTPALAEPRRGDPRAPATIRARSMRRCSCP